MLTHNFRLDFARDKFIKKERKRKFPHGKRVRNRKVIDAAV